MSNLVDLFIEDVRTVENASRSNRRFMIRNKITDFENLIRGSGSGLDAINSILHLAKERVFQEISRHSPDGVPTEHAEFFQEVLDALSTRLRTFIEEAKAGYRVSVIIAGGLPHVAKGELPTVEAAQAWRDSDTGDTFIRSIITTQKHETGRTV